MFQVIENLKEELDSIRSAKQIEPLLSRLAGDFGFPSYLLAWTRLPAAGPRFQEVPERITNFPAEWLERYWQRRYYEDDCVMRKCLAGGGPVVWAEAEEPGRLTARQKRIAQEAALAGLGMGVSVPVHGPRGRFTVLSLARFRPGWPGDRAPSAARHLVHIAAIALNDAVWRITGGAPEDPEPPALKPMEAACLLWAARGKTSGEIGEILGIPERTVYFHTSNAMHALGVATRIQAVATAVARGIITLW